MVGKVAACLDIWEIYMTLPHDAILADLVDETLANPENTVADIFGTMHACHRQYGNAFLRIGVTGTGVAPYHKIFYETDGEERLYKTYYGSGRNDDSYQPAADAWSTRAMSYDDVRVLLTKLRGFKPKS